MTNEPKRQIISKGQTIMELRVRAGYSARALADAAHINKITVASAELGRSVRPATAAAICAALGAGFDELFEIRSSAGA